MLLTLYWSILSNYEIVHIQVLGETTGKHSRVVKKSVVYFNFLELDAKNMIPAL